jgi:hypothetical protein
MSELKLSDEQIDNAARAMINAPYVGRFPLTKEPDMWRQASEVTKDFWRGNARAAAPHLQSQPDPVDGDRTALLASHKKLVDALRYVQDKCQLYGAADAAREKIDAALLEAKQWEESQKVSEQ